MKGREGWSQDLSRRFMCRASTFFLLILCVLIVSVKEKVCIGFYGGLRVMAHVQYGVEYRQSEVS